MGTRHPPQGHEERQSVVTDLFTGQILAKTAAERLASLTLKGDPEGGLCRLWGSIMIFMIDYPKRLDKLADLLVNMASLPIAKDDDGNPLLIYDMKVWSGLPMLDWEFRDEWNGPQISEDDSKTAKQSKEF